MPNQTIFLLRTLLLLKSWRLLLILPVMVLLLFSLQLCFFWAGQFVETRMKRAVTAVSALNFKGYSQQVSAASTSNNLRQELSNFDVVFKRMISTDKQGIFGNYSTVSCDSDVGATFPRRIAGQRRYHIDFTRFATLCQTSYTSMLCCAMFASVVCRKDFLSVWSKNGFRSVHVFQYVSAPSYMYSNKNLKSKQSHDDQTYFLLLPKILPFEMALVTAIVCAYLLITTVSCISQLKSQGFLQLMVRKGLSPFSFWASVWITTSLELLVLTTSLVLSFFIQCPTIYSANQLLHSALIIASYVFCQTALVLLLTVLSNSYYTICKLVFLYIAVFMGLTLADRFASELKSDYVDFRVLRKALPWLPCLSVVNLLQGNFEGQVNPNLDTKSGTVGSDITIGTFVVLVFVTLYLDHVLKSGNGRCYPACFLFSRVPGDEVLSEILGEARPSVEHLDLKIFVRVSGLSRCTDNATVGRGINVDLYDNQLAAVYGEDSAPTRLLLDALTCRERVNSGFVWIDGCPASNRMARPFENIRLGECPQDDALCFNLTVLHCLRMAVISSGNDWLGSESEVSKVVSLLRLVGKLPCLVGELSCGQRRQLCVAMALLGRPRLVVLSDPTRGMDPPTRLRLWRLLQDYRRERCIIVSTNFIDEVSAYADRAVFLSTAADSVLCAGSSGFLRSAVICDLVVQATLSSDAPTAENILNKLPPGVAASVQKASLLVRLSGSNPRILEDTLTALKGLGKSVGSVGVNHPLLSDVYKRLKRLDVHEINHIFLNKTGQREQNNRADALEDGQRASIGDAGNTEKLDGELQVKSDVSCSMCAVFKLHCCLVQRNWGVLVLKAIVCLALLLLHVYVLLVERRLLSARSAVWTNVSEESQLIRGFCISDYDIPDYHNRISDAGCNFLYTRVEKADSRFIILWKSRKMHLYEFLELSNVTVLLRDHCYKLLPPELPCGIVYSNSWYKFLNNSKRQMAMGSYSQHTNFEPEKAATSAYLASKAAMEYFLDLRIGGKGNLIMFLDLHHYTVGIYGVLSLSFIIATVPALFFDDVIERNTLKRRSYMASLGISSMTYWTGFLLLHWLQYAAAYCLAFVLGVAIDGQVFMTAYAAVSAVMTVGCGLINNLLIVYLLCVIFPSFRLILPATHLLLSVIVGMLPGLLLKSNDTVCLALIIAMPPLAPAALMLYSARLHIYANDIEPKGTLAKVPAMFGQKQVLICMIAIPIQTVLLAVALAIADRVRGNCNCCSRTSDANGAEGQSKCDSDAASSALLPVPANKGPTKASDSEQCTVQLQRMGKSYSKVNALWDVTLSVAKGETLGIIGSNGSGVTTLIGGIIGRERPSSGKCQVRAAGSWVSGRQVYGLTAYAPQCSHILFGTLTAAEHLLYYAGMLGASGDKVRRLLRDFNLDDCQHRPTSQLTDGLKRRLSIAISMLSSSPLLVIDDASTGINPNGEAQQLWRILRTTSSDYASSVISAHSLMGAEAVGCRVVLISNGVVVFQGTVDKLRQRRGFNVLEIEIATKSPEAARQKKEAILTAITGRFFSTGMLEQTPKRMRISVPAQEVGTQFDSLSWLLQMKEHHGIASLLFYPATADQILEAVLKSQEAAGQQEGETIAGQDQWLLMTSFYEQNEP